jgi:hypothetical protein
VPATLICERVTAEFPVFVSVTACVPLLPMVTLPKLNAVGLAESCRTWDTPVPESMTLRGEFGALLTSVRAPVVLLAEAGVKLTVKTAELPGTSVRGKVTPLNAKPVPLTVACVMLRLALPGLLTVTDWVLVMPTVTLPKLTLVGTTEIWGCTPVPASEIVAGELLALLTTVTLGENPTSSETLWPADSVTGGVTPLAVKPAPLTLICEMLTLEFPVLVNVTA